MIKDIDKKNVLIHSCNDDVIYNKRFLDEHVWFNPRISKEMLGRIKYVALYRKATEHHPSVITHYGVVRPDQFGIVPYGKTNGYLINLSEVKKLKPIVRTEETISNFQSHYYCSFDTLMSASTLDQLELDWTNRVYVFL